MYEGIIEDIVQEMLEILGEENDNIQNSSDNPGPSTTQSEIYHNKVSDEVPKTQNSSMEDSSMEYASAEVINVPSDSDDDRDYYYNNTSDLNDISIIGTVKPVAIDTAPSRFLSHLSDEIHAEPLIKTLNPALAVASSSDRQATSVSSNAQDGLKTKVEENNNDVTYTKTVSGMKGLSENPKPGCSKDSDDTSQKLKGSSPNLDELLKDAKLIHALLPRFSYRLIYRTLCNNKFARNRIELTLWDLLPIERPQPQFIRKRKTLDEVCVVECKKSNHFNASLQKDQLDTKTAVDKKEQCMKHVMVGDIEKLEGRLAPFASLTGEIDEMKRNMLQVAVLNDTNNDIDQPSAAMLMKNIRLDNTLEEYIERGNIYIDTLLTHNDTSRHIVQDSKKSVSSEASSKTEELQSIKNSRVKKKPVLHLDSIATFPVATVLQPAKLTFETNFMPLQKIMYPKPPAPILSPPKLQFIRRSSIQVPTNVMQMKQDGPIVPSANLNLSANDSSAVRLPSTSSNDKGASHFDDVPSLAWSKHAISRGISDVKFNNLSKVMETEDTKLVNVCTKVQQWLNEPSHNRPSSSVEIAQNILDHQRANSSKTYNFDQNVSNMSTSRACDGGDEQQLIEEMLTNIIQEDGIEDVITNPTQVDTVKDADFKEVKGTTNEQNVINIGNIINKGNASKEKSKYIEIDADYKKIILNDREYKIYLKLIPMFSCVKTQFIKQLCHGYIKDYEQYNDDVLLENLIDMLLNCDQENLKKIKPFPAALPVEESDPSYDMNEQYADLLTIFPEADPVYLRKIAEEIHGNHERIKEFVQSKLEKPDYPTRAEYLAKKKITEQQKQYTTDFKVQQFLEIFPDPFSYFEDDKRNCEFNAHAIDFLKYYFSKLRVNTLVKAYSKYMHNLSLTAKALEALNPDLKTKRQCNKMILTEDIPFLQECAFIQHKADLRKYLDEVKAKEEQEFNELKIKNELLECQCCYDNECMPSKCSTCEDGHVFCNSCIIRFTDVVLGDGNTRVDCLLKCGCEFPISVLQRVLPPTKFSILLCKRQEAEVIAAGVEGLVSCPFCHFASIPPPEDKIFKCLNPECMKESCRLCKELNHIPLKCNEKKADSARLYLEERMTEALVRKCYRCSRMFFKEEGCNKMTCICGAQMCYICDKPVTNYKHFQGQGAERSNLCPLWSDDRRMNAESVIKVCQETVKQIKEKDPQIDINVDALLPKLPPKSKGPHDDIHNMHNRMDARQFPYG